MKTGLATIVLSFFCCSSVLAYVPAADYVLDQWMRHIRKVKTLHVQQIATLYSDRLPDGKVVVQEEIWIEPPLRYRREAHYSSGLVNELVLPDQSLRISAGRVERRPPLNVLGPLGVLWVSGSKERLTSLLMQLKVSMEHVRWALHEGEVIYEIGAKNGSRIQFEKNTWRPIGAVWGGMEYRFIHSKDKAYPAPYPEGIEVFKNGTQIVRVDIQQLSAGNSFKKSVFDLQHLRLKGQTQ